MLVLFNVPNAVRKSSSLSASDFLLFRSPLGELDLVREQYAASHDVNKFELGLNGPNTILGLLPIGHLLDDLNTEVVISIALKTLVSVCRNLILPIGLGDRRSNIMRMEASVGGYVVKLDGISVLDEVWRVD